MISSNSPTQSIRLLKKLEKGIIILIIIYQSGVWWHPPVLDSDYGVVKVGSGLITLINLGIYLFTLLCILINWKRFFYVLTRDKLLLLLLGTAFFSIFWSADPSQGMEVAKGTVRVTFFGIYLSTRYSLKEQLHLLAWSSGMIAILSLAICLVLPSQGIQIAHSGDMAGWRGLLGQKNHFGRLMIFSSGAFLLLALSNYKYRQVLWAGFSLCLSLLLLSNSKTALSTFLVVLMLLPFWLVLRQKSYNLRMFLLHVALLLGGILLVGITYYFEPILTAMGKDVTLTGRVPLWTVLLQKFADKPLFGYGYHGFWSQEIRTEIATKIGGWDGGHAHNGFLEVALDIGLFGLVILLLFLIRSYWRAVNYAGLAKTTEGLWPMQVLTIILIANIAVDNTFLSPTFIWMFHVSINYSLAIYCDRRKRIKSRQLKEYVT